MLEIRGRDDDGVDVLAIVELVVVAAERRPRPAGLLDERRPFLAPARPDVRHRRNLEVQLRGVPVEPGDERLPAAIREADDADADSIVGAEDTALRTGVRSEGEPGGAGARHSNEVTTRRFHTPSTLNLS